MQHLDSKYREEDVADEVQIEDLLQRRAEKLDVGSLAGGEISTQALKISRTHDIDTTSKGFGGHCQPHQGGITAIASAHDGDMLWIGYAVVNCPVDPIDEVIVHFTGKFTDKGVS